MEEKNRELKILLQLERMESLYTKARESYSDSWNRSTKDKTHFLYLIEAKKEEAELDRLLAETLKK